VDVGREDCGDCVLGLEEGENMREPIEGKAYRFYLSEQ